MFNKKDRLLGERERVASQRLQRMLLFRLGQELGRDICYHCGERVDLASFSVEHKQPWQSAPDPQASFFDLENIAFSHLRCNTLAGGAVWQRSKTHCPQGHEYTTENTYYWHDERKCRACRRDVSRNTATERQRRYRARLKEGVA